MEAECFAFFFLRGGATGGSGASISTGRTRILPFEFAGGLVLAITSGSCNGNGNGIFASRGIVDKVRVLGYWDASFELGVDSESWELLDNADTDGALAFSSATDPSNS